MVHKTPINCPNCGTFCFNAEDYMFCVITQDICCPHCGKVVLYANNGISYNASCTTGRIQSDRPNFSAKPQHSYMSEATIDRFAGEYHFLSNFYPSKIVLEGRDYPTVEHAFQASKAFILDEILQIQQAPNPGKAKRLGKMCHLREDWNEVKIPIMKKCLELKFAEGSELAYKLIATHPKTLVEGNDWYDTYWGVCEGIGENHLGKLLMARRDELIIQRLKEERDIAKKLQ